MMKTLYMIGGTMGVGKTTVCQQLKQDLPNSVFLDDKQTYLGSQLESDFGICFGIAANMDFLLICSYEENGENPELVIYKKR